MASNTSINLVDLDFKALKSSLKNYLRDNDQFKDYDYEASNINLLLDLLSYNTHKNAFFLNMVLSESFLDSAQLRNSIFSHAKELNYLPRSSRSAVARIKVDFEASGENAPYVIAKGSPFTSIIKNDAYTFTTAEDITVSSTNNVYSFETDIYEGIYLKDTYEFNTSVDNPKFKITNRNVDTRSITVKVYEDGNERFDLYTFAASLLDLNQNSLKYFMQPNENGYYEILFGDNNIGRRPKNNSIIVIEYRISSGDLANGAKIFSIDFDPTGNDELTDSAEVNTYENARDGSPAESIDSIKYIAPRHFQIQERCITPQDYAVSLRAQFPEINTVFAYGGEDANPQQFGRVFISVDIQNVTGLPDSKKTEYYNFIKSRSPFGILPIFIEPEYAYLSINSVVRYNLNITNFSKETIKTSIKNKIIEFRDDNLNDFNVILRKSKLQKEIDDADDSIISSITEVNLYKKINPTLGAFVDYDIEFGVAIDDTIPKRDTTHPSRYIHSVSSSAFTYKSELAIIEDDGDGNLWVLKTNGNIDEKITDVGTVDYATGIIKIRNLKVDSYQGSAIKIFIKTKDSDIPAKLNNILTIEDNEINIVLEELRL